MSGYNGVLSSSLMSSFLKTFTRHSDGFSTIVEQDALLWFIPCPNAPLGVFIFCCGPSEKRRLLGTFPSGLLSIFRLVFLAAPLLGISCILFNSLPITRLVMLSGRDREFDIFVGILYCISTGTSPREGRDLRRPLCGAWLNFITRSPGVSSAEFRRGLVSDRPVSPFSSKHFVVSFSCVLASFNFKVEKASITVWNSVLRDELQELIRADGSSIDFSLSIMLCEMPDKSIRKGVDSTLKAWSIRSNSPSLVMLEMLQS